MNQDPTPFTVLGGFLGAGKTTLLNRLLTESTSHRYAILVNDFGKINIDEALVTKHDGQTLTLSNGCICCSLADGFINTLLTLMQRRDEFDHIVVEASGVSEPQRIMDIARLDPELHADAIVVLVDCRHLHEHLDNRAVASVVRAQISSANLVLLNKTDLVNHAELESVTTVVQRLNTSAQSLPCVQARIPIELLTGNNLLGFNTTVIKKHNNAFSKPTASGASNPQPISLHTANLEFDSIDRTEFNRFCSSLTTGVIRGKGLIRLKNEPGIWLWQKISNQQSLVRYENRPKMDQIAKANSASNIVLIGTESPLYDAKFNYFDSEQAASLE